MCSNISATTASGEYISVSCHVFIDRGLLPTTKLQNQGSLDMKMKSSLRRFYYCYHDLVNCHGKYVTNDLGYIGCRNEILFFFFFRGLLPDFWNDQHEVCRRPCA